MGPNSICIAPTPVNQFVDVEVCIVVDAMDSFFEIFHCGSPSSFQYCNLSSPSLPRRHYLSATWENTEHLSRFELLEPSQVHSFRFNGPQTLHCDLRYLEYEFRAHTRKQQISTQYPYAVV